MAQRATDIEIARSRTLRPIGEIAQELGLSEDELSFYGRDQAKVRMSSVSRLLSSDAPEAPIVLVSSMSPSEAGAGKTTCSIGLAQSLQLSGRRAIVTLREPSMGPVFGRKGGAAGGGYSQVLPMETINLHFTGDMHAITASNNLIAAALDNELHFDNAHRIARERVLWQRCMDMNDRALRQIVIGREDEADRPFFERSFCITAGSTIMAVLCLSQTYSELKARIGDILLAFTEDAEPFTCRDLGVQGAATALLREALEPNLVQTLEGGPAFVHGGPFANIAQGTCSVLSMKLARKLADYVVTEAGFGFDLGGEKFLNLVGPAGGLTPSAVVLVATVRSLKAHGGVSANDLQTPDVEAVRAGGPNLAKHVENVRKFGLEPIVAINRFPSDTSAELEAAGSICEACGAAWSVVDFHAQGGRGGVELAGLVEEAVERSRRSDASPVGPLYDWNDSVESKIATVAREIYGAADVDYTFAAREDLRLIEEHGHEKLPICMAKTHRSLSDQPELRGRPEGFTLNVRQIIMSRGAGFLIPMTGPILRMPGLPRRPAAMEIDIDDEGAITGLF